MGKSRTGSSTSRMRVFTAIAEKIVPTATRPMLPSNITSASGSSRGSSEMPEITAIAGRISASTSSRKRRLAAALPR